MAQTTSAAQQGDNIAHALAGAGGGLLSMTLTLAHTPSNTLTVALTPIQLPIDHTLYSCSGRV